MMALLMGYALSLGLAAWVLQPIIRGASAGSRSPNVACPGCGEPLEPDARFCSSCGTPLRN